MAILFMYMHFAHKSASSVIIDLVDYVPRIGNSVLTSNVFRIICVALELLLQFIISVCAMAIQLDSVT